MKKIALLFGWLLAACGSDSSGSAPAASADAAPSDDAGVLPGTEAGADAAADAPAICARAAKAADRARKVVVSHPFKASGVKGTSFEVLDLSPTGALSKANVKFDMGTANESPIAFTPDGEIGLVAQEDGSIGVFSIDAAGAVKVIHAAFKGAFYASGIVVDTVTGSRAFVLDSNTEANGGGVYEVAIGCDGTLTQKSKIVPGGSANAMALLPTDPTRAVLAAKKAFSSAAGTDTHVVDLAGVSLVASGTAFSDGNAIPSSIAVTPDAKYALVADDSVVAGNRIAVVALPAMNLVQTLTTEYPAAVVASPFGNAAIALNDDSTDEITVLKYDAQSVATPFSITGRMTYAFPKPQIPTTAAMIDRGALKGRVLVSENLAVRQVQFTQQGGVTDTEKFSLGNDIPSIVGVVGVQP